MSDDAYEDDNGDDDDDSDELEVEFPWGVLAWILAFVATVVSVITGIVFYLTMWKKG